MSPKVYVSNLSHFYQDPKSRLASGSDYLGRRSDLLDGSETESPGTQAAESHPISPLNGQYLPGVLS